MINGVDVSDPTRAFTNDKWARLEYNGGRSYVLQARERMNGRGGRGGRGGRDNRGGGRSNGDGRNVGAVGLERGENGSQDEGSNQQQNGGGERGAQHGRGFG